MIRKKYHKLIAKILLGCMLVIGMPLHDFLHTHAHIQSNGHDTFHQHQFSKNVQHVVDINDCIACSISQLAHTLYIKADQMSLTCSVVRQSLHSFADCVVQLSVFRIKGRAPPCL